MKKQKIIVEPKKNISLFTYLQRTYAWLIDKKYCELLIALKDFESDLNMLFKRGKRLRNYEIYEANGPGYFEC